MKSHKVNCIFNEISSIANAFYNLAGLYIEKGDLLQAEIHLRKAIDLKPDFAISHYNLGFILKNLGRLKEAKFYIKNAIEIDPHLTDAYFSLSTMKETENDQKWKNHL